MCLTAMYGKRIVPIERMKQKPFGIKARNVGQSFMQEALLQSTEVAPLVIIKGSPLCCQLTMLADECERSPPAFDAAGRM